MDSPKYAAFDVSETTYKTVNGQALSAFAMVPKGLPPGQYPIIAKFHGGYFITGASLYPDWFAQWTLDYALQHSALVIAADYRLVPESTGLDILDDLRDFWAWVRSGELQKHVSQAHPGVQINLDQVIAYGESAGGNLALQSGLTLPRGFIKGVIATYPVIDQRKKRVAPVPGVPTIPAEVLESFLQAREPGRIVTSAVPPARLSIALSIEQQDRTAEFYGADPRLYPLEVLETVEYVPPTLILHGTDDTGVPVEGSVEFAEAATRKFGEGRVQLITRPGDHGFDVGVPLETPWLQEGLAWVGFENFHQWSI